VTLHVSLLLHSRFDKFRRTLLGKQLEALITDEARYAEFAALSRAEVPAIAALVHDLESRFPELAHDPSARQFCGSMVAAVMRSHRHDVLRPRGRVPGKLLTFGAVFTPLPAERSFDALIDRLNSMPERLRERLDTGSDYLTVQLPEHGFSLIEHVCHLRDLEIEAFGIRVGRVLKDDLPLLDSVDGTALAAQRSYRTEAANQAFDSFSKARRRLVGRLRRLTDDQRRRMGVRDGIKRMTVDDLAWEIDDHDQTHILEMDELLLSLKESAGKDRCTLAPTSRRPSRADTEQPSPG
jgi:hypothetical protein